MSLLIVTYKQCVFVTLVSVHLQTAFRYDSSFHPVTWPIKSSVIYFCNLLLLLLKQCQSIYKTQGHNEE